MSRGWTWIDEDHKDEDRVVPILDELAARWSSIMSSIEQRGWDRQAAYEDGDPGPYFDTDEEEQEFKETQQEREELDMLRLEGIESELSHFGARMMRPYEHWNEDEKYMEYMERER